MAAPAAAERVRSGRAQLGEIELAYDVFGDGGRPLLLIMGIGAQRVFWDDRMCTELVGAGFHVARFDHRDIGESSRLDLPVPHPGKMLALRMLGRVTPPPYTLSDMARDAAQLIRHLGWGSAHVVGTSMGGMIGQHLALEHPDAVRSLTSIMSTPGGRRYLPKPFALKALFMKPPRTPEEAGDSVDTFFRTVGGYGYPHDSDRLRAIGQLSHQRGVNPRGFLRHFAAIMGTADRRPAMKGSRVPTLVIHGTSDPLIPPSAGRATARLIPNATWLPISGMGHGLPSAVWPTVVSAIARHAERADARATV
ncbi:MAG: alpha/beta hydrolase [Myxococcales bacterium]|nr:alpha/beta hydrolase [Myxococcales bacterium]